MSHVRPSGRRLAAVVTVVLAVTAGLTGMSGPAGAAPSAPVSAGGLQAAADSVAPFPADRELTSVTASGYVVRDSAMRQRSWVRASDGAVTELGEVAVRATGHGDLVALIGDPGVEVRDLATGRTVLSVPTAPADGVDYAGSAGQAVFTTDRDATGGSELWMHTADGSAPVTGLPQDARNHFIATSTSADALVRYTTGSSERRLGLLDLATGAVTEPDLSNATHVANDIALSATHVAWVERDDAKTSVVVRDRDTGRNQRIPMGDNVSPYLEIGLQGDYLTYARKGGLTAGAPDPLHPLTAYSLKDGTTTELLDHVVSADTSPSGVLHVRGGTVAEGEGVYRVAPGSDGAAPTATLVASTGEPTELALGRHDVPSVIDFSRNGTAVPMVWNLSRPNAELSVTLRHDRTGKTAEFTMRHVTAARFSIAWNGDLDQGSLSAYNGDYTWEIAARPLNDIGPTLTRSGTFKVVRSVASPHDFTDNGSPDLLARDSSGRLWRDDAHYTREGGLSHTGSGGGLVGGGWNTYDQIEAGGDLGGAAHGDLVARDKAGVLWLYLGKGDGTFAARTRVGGGWGVYDKIAAGSDATNDGKSDLLATDKSGVLWLYKGTGDWRAPFAGRVKAGTGYGAYDQITATGDIGGAATGDLVARDAAGVLWLHLGRGDGTFAARTRIGGGWNTYQETVGIGDANHDGHPDLFAHGSNGTRYFYAGTSDWRAPFAAREASTLFPAQQNVTSVS
ncbi:FG-GAP repeat domain-containing protein [Streptomyces sp. H62]